MLASVLAMQVHQGMRYANDRQISRVTIAGLAIAAIIVAVILALVLSGGVDRLFALI